MSRNRIKAIALMLLVVGASACSPGEEVDEETVGPLVASPTMEVQSEQDPAIATCGEWLAASDTQRLAQARERLPEFFRQDGISPRQANGFAEGPIGDDFARDMTDECRKASSSGELVEDVAFRTYQEHRCLYTDVCIEY